MSPDLERELRRAPGLAQYAFGLRNGDAIGEGIAEFTPSGPLDTVKALAVACRSTTIARVGVAPNQVIVVVGGDAISIAAEPDKPSPESNGALVAQYRPS